jgi:nucleoside-diphosphate-sugar epimerase
VRVLVTGATGFTGGHLARHLRARGHGVWALVRDPERAEDLRRDGIELMRGDFKPAVWKHELACSDVPGCTIEGSEAPGAELHAAGHMEFREHAVRCGVRNLTFWSRRRESRASIADGFLGF